MKRLKHTVSMIEHYKKQFGNNNVDIEKCQNTLIKKKIRITHSFLKKIKTLNYSGSLNDFLRELSKNISDREALMLIYDLEDRLNKIKNKKSFLTAEKKENKIQKLEKKFQNISKKRHDKVLKALNEESRIRKLNIPNSIKKDHCHIHKKYFDYSSEKKLKKLIELTENRFNSIMYQFAIELAALANKWNRMNYFDWRGFAYSGFNKNDYYNYLNTRIKHLKIIGLSEDADLNQIKKRYKQLAKKNHPDKGGNSEKMSKINISYNYLIKNTYK